MVKKKADFEKAINAAYEALEVHEIVDFPINMHSVFGDYDNLTVYTYGEIMKMTGLTRQQVIERCCSTEGSLSYDASTDHYIISYNEVVERKRPESRIYWTLAHEFGHFYLKHNKEKMEARLAMLSLRKRDYDAYEMEADFFARFFLNPPSLVSKAKYMTSERLSSFFGVTHTVAEKTINYIRNTFNRGWNFHIPQQLLEQFSDFMYKLDKGQTCSNCNTFFLMSDNDQFCPSCGSSKLHKFRKGDDFNMKYQGINVDENGKALICPMCNNEETTSLPGDHCMICGNHIVNNCSRLEFGWNDEYYPTCPDPLPGNARFCVHCGAESTFLRNGILKPWSMVQKEQEEQEEQKNFFKIV